MIERVRIAIASDRFLAVDALRGLVIVVMALDHANHFVAQKHSSGEYWGGPFPVYSTALPFLTRFVTHLAAPGFFFLMGVGMALYKAKRSRDGQSRYQIVSHFWVRGGLLIALQFLLINRAWQMSPGGWGPNTYIGVLFALGGAMIISSLLLWFRPSHLLLIAALLFLGLELIHPDPAAWRQLSFTDLQLIFLHPGGDLRLWSNYPILPWLELTVFGLAFGQHLSNQPGRTFRRGLSLGVGTLLLFVFIRALDGFGNVRPMAGRTWIDFLNVVKYPPSWAFTLLTMGVNLVLLWFFSRIAEKQKSLLQPLAVYGRAPLFFYVAHLFLYAALGALFAPSGTSIPAMLPFWLLGLLILFPLCITYAWLKQTRPAGRVLRYL